MRTEKVINQAQPSTYCAAGLNFLPGLKSKGVNINSEDPENFASKDLTDFRVLWGKLAMKMK